jgi:transcriptional regulator with XRE-family HTH domain
MAVGTTRGKRRLGRYIKPIRLRSGLKPEQVAEEARCSRQTVTRLEAGDNLPRIHLFTTLLSVIGATDEERAAALQLWEVADADTATMEQAEDLPAKYRRFRLDESEAELSKSFDTVVIPGMLQTSEYTSALAHGRRKLAPETWRESRAVAERRERQALLVRPDRPLKLHALIHESVLTWLVGGAEIMVAQLNHLLASDELSNVTIQVVPKEFGAHGAMSGPLFILSFPEDDEPDAVYVESVLGIENVGKPSDVEALSTVWGEVAAAAPSPDRTAEIIQKARDSVKGR